MALPNPTIDPPDLAFSSKRSLHSRSPSRSPIRRYHSVRDIDPLLRDLSPTQTLRAFTSGPEGHANDYLSRSVESAPLAQRRLGIQAAQSSLDLRSWARELESWEWPGTFDEPEPAKKKQRMSLMSIGSAISHPSVTQEEEGEDEYWGSLPAERVRAYQRRLDEISEDLEEVDVEGLKAFVLSAHSQAGYGEADVDDSIGAIGADTNLKRLDDFTALVTATILQSLPYLSRLHRLLNTWNVRLNILRRASDYLRDLAQAHTDLDHGWAALAVSSHPAAADALQRANATFSRETMLEMRNVVQTQVSSLGSRLDHFLDMLEGREECVPDIWIENFETLEQQYGQWAVQAERKVLENEWKTSSPRDAGMNGNAVDSQDVYPEQTAPSRVLTNDAVQSSSSVTVGPTIVSSAVVGSALGMAVNTSTHTTSTSPRNTIITTTAPSSTTHTSTSTEQTTTSSNRSPKVIASSSTRQTRPRHVPIDIDSYKDECTNTVATEPVPPLPATAGRDISAPPLAAAISPDDAGASSQMVKKRAAFLNGDIEKSERLNKSKPPPIVRPFEHASTAFTRLFKREKDEEKADGGSRSSSVGSRGSKKVAKKSSRSKMVYADLFTAPQMAEERDETPSPNESRQRTKKPDSRVTDYIDMMSVPQRSSSDGTRRSSRPVTPRQHTYPTEGASGRSRTMSNRSKRSSKQNITALPTENEPDLPVPLPAPVVVPSAKYDPDTFLPTGLSSPFHSPTEPEPGLDVPENWPLSGEVSPALETDDPMTSTNMAEEAETETSFSDRPLSSEVFENLFVSSMPLSPRRGVTSGINAANEKETRFSDVSNSDDFYLVKPAADRSLLRTGRSLENVRLDDSPDPTFRPVSMVMEADEGFGGEKDIEDGEMGTARSVHSAGNAAAYFGDPGSSPPISSGKARLTNESQHSRSTPPVSPMPLKLKIPSTSPSNDPTPTEIGRDGDLGLIRRASAKSIEMYPRSSLKSIDVVAPRSQPQTPLDSAPNSVEKGRLSMEPFTPQSPLHYKDDMYFPSPPSVPPRRSSLTYSPDGRTSIDLGELNAAMAKSKRKDPRRSTESSKQRDTPPKQRNSPLKPGEDNFDRHVSEVLDSVHASNIKFRTRPGAATPLPQRIAGKLSKISERSTGNMTLAPAEPSPKKSAATDREVKLYHLMQAGRAEPIKLYVRLVGEGERVMVRVGGGWADLADYLRQYAEHHGSRTVSEGGLQLQTAGVANGHGKRTFSGPASSLAKVPTQRSTPVTPGTALSTFDRSGTIAEDDQWLGQEQPNFTMGDSDDSASPSPLVTQRPATAGSTPRSATTTSRPSTSHSAKLLDGWSTPFAENSPAGNLGMAGPASSSRMKADLPEQKARWVEGMIERVNKSASAEKSREKQFADIGKVGSTRRLAFRQSSTGTGL